MTDSSRNAEKSHRRLSSLLWPCTAESPLLFEHDFFYFKKQDLLKVTGSKMATNAIPSLHQALVAPHLGIYSATVPCCQKQAWLS